MAAKILGQTFITGSGYTTLYTVPSGYEASFTVAFVNIGTAITGVAASFAITDSGVTTPSGEHWIEYGTILESGQVLERTALVAEENRNVVVYSDNASGLAVSAYGYEEVVV
jgi:hypothetical protein